MCYGTSVSHGSDKQTLLIGAPDDGMQEGMTDSASLVKWYDMAWAQGRAVAVLI